MGFRGRKRTLKETPPSPSILGGTAWSKSLPLWRNSFGRAWGGSKKRKKKHKEFLADAPLRKTISPILLIQRKDEGGRKRGTLDGICSTPRRERFTQGRQFSLPRGKSNKSAKKIKGPFYRGHPRRESGVALKGTKERKEKELFTLEPPKKNKKKKPEKKVS